MSERFATQTVLFRFQFSDRTLLSVPRDLRVRLFGIGDGVCAWEQQLPSLEATDAGVMLRSLPVEQDAQSAAGDSRIARQRINGEDFLSYVLQRFPRYYIEMAGQTFEAYKAKFSGKTRSTLSRKLKKWVELSGGQLRWERFTRPEEMARFWDQARQVSARSYQERLLDAGLPDDADYRAQALRWAAKDQVRAYLLFDRERPVSYLFCPIHDDIIDYAYLGYDPEYQRHSVGTVLQWLALEDLFAEQRFRYFDFTEGESEHKRLFATGHLNCVNLALLRPTLGNRLLVHAHLRFTQAIEAIGRWLDERQLKTRVKRWLRFA